jgi:hypothetical protein
MSHRETRFISQMNIYIAGCRRKIESRLLSTYPTFHLRIMLTRVMYVPNNLHLYKALFFYMSKRSNLAKCCNIDVAFMY